VDEARMKESLDKDETNNDHEHMWMEKKWGGSLASTP
jgi:hypothetical protein